MGLIIRTVAAGVSEEALREDVEYLAKLWHSLMARFKMKSKGANLLYRDADLIIRTVRDSLTHDVDAMLIDNQAIYQRVRDFVQLLSPELTEKSVITIAGNLSLSTMALRKNWIIWAAER
jgi:ribonuclease G